MKKPITALYQSTYNIYLLPFTECDLDLDRNSPQMKTNILSDLLQLGSNEDLSPYTRLAVEEENELSSDSRGKYIIQNIQKYSIARFFLKSFFF